jgi:hypothetical protein
MKINQNDYYIFLKNAFGNKRHFCLWSMSACQNRNGRPFGNVLASGDKN